MKKNYRDDVKYELNSDELDQNRKNPINILNKKKLQPIWSDIADNILNVTDPNEKLNKLKKISDLFISSDTALAFLNTHNNLGIAATKGLGKTYLLMLKRYKLEKDFLCLPQHLYLDHCNSIIINSELSKIFGPKNNNSRLVYENWPKVWSIAISISVIKNFAQELKIYPNAFSENLSAAVKIINIADHFKTTSDILSHIFTLGIDEFKQLIGLENELRSILSNSVNRPIAIFIDSADHANVQINNKPYPDRKLNDFLQISLMETAKIFLRKVPHVKIYFSIRQDALRKASNYVAHIDHALGSVVKLSYKKPEIELMFKNYIENENDSFLSFPQLKKTNHAMAFLGTETIPNSLIDEEEDVFNYIHRHTFRRPRDLMAVCRDLALENCKGDKTKIYDTIAISIDKILLNYISGLKGISYANDEPIGEQDEESCLKDIFPNEFLKHIPCDILTISLMKKICARNSNQEYTQCNKMNCYECKISKHYFDKLYSIGLLGIIKKKRESEEYYEKLISIDEITDLKDDLKFSLQNKENLLYTVHTAISKKVKSIVRNEDFRFVKSILVNSYNKITKTQYKEALAEISEIEKNY